MMLVKRSPLPTLLFDLTQQHRSAQKEDLKGKYHGAGMPYFPEGLKRTKDVLIIHKTLFKDKITSNHKVLYLLQLGVIPQLKTLSQNARVQSYSLYKYS